MHAIIGATIRRHTIRAYSAIRLISLNNTKEWCLWSWTAIRGASDRSYLPTGGVWSAHPLERGRAQRYFAVVARVARRHIYGRFGTSGVLVDTQSKEIVKRRYRQAIYWHHYEVLLKLSFSFGVYRKIRSPSRGKISLKICKAGQINCPAFLLMIFFNKTVTKTAPYMSTTCIELFFRTLEKRNENTIILIEPSLF